MKNNLLFLIPCFFILNFSPVKAQNYVAFPDSSAAWYVYYWASDMGTIYIRNITTYFIHGDTSINDNVYQKIYRVNSTTPIDTGNAIYLGGIREDSMKRVYYIGAHPGQGYCYSNDSTELLLYQFGLAEGDTIFFNHPANSDSSVVINSADSIYIGNEYRKTYQTNTSTWIEGIGSTNGLFYPLCTGFQEGWQLYCFYQDDHWLYSTYNYCENVSVEERDLAREISVFPNPFTNTLMVKTDFAGTLPLNLSIFNLFGERVYSAPFRAPQTQLDLTILPSGIYLVKISHSKGQFSTKVIKN